jgi:hypothetical protein
MPEKPGKYIYQAPKANMFWTHIDLKEATVVTHALPP